MPSCEGKIMLLLIINQLIIMTIIMILGFICYKTKIVNQEGNKVCSNLLLLLVNPAVIINVYQIDFDASMARLLGVAFLAAIASHLIAILAATLLIRKKTNPEFDIDRVSIVYSNCAFMGIPLINAVMGSEGVFFLSAYIAIFNLCLWTHGVSTMKGSFSLKNLKYGLLSPVFLATVIAIILYFAQIRLPHIVTDSLGFIANMMTPLAMLIAGFSLAQADLKHMFLKFSIYKVIFIKAFVVPLLTLAVLLPFSLDSRVVYTTMIAVACPTAVAGTMLSIRYNRNYTYSSEIFVLNTIVALVSIPLVMFVTEKVLNML